MTKTMEEIQREDKHITHYEESELQEFPELDYSRFRGDSGMTEVVYGIIKEYLSRPCWTDDFKDEGKRNKWEDEMRGEHGEEAKKFLEKNSLRGNTLNNLFSILESFESRYQGKNKEEVERLCQEVEQYRIRMDPKRTTSKKSEYEGIAPRDRLELVKEIKEKVYDALVVMSK